MRYDIFYSKLFLVVALLLSACGGEQNRPTIKITTLENGGQVNVGQQIAVGFEAADVKGVIQVELTINGEPTYVEAADPPVNIFSGSYPWKPEQAGSYLIQVVTFNVDGQASDPAQVAIRVEETAGAFAPTPTISPVELIPAEATTLAAIPTILVPPTPSGSMQTDLIPRVTAKVNLNVRTGPGIPYPTIGRLSEGQTAEISGRSADSGWWQIFYDSDVSENGEQGWVTADVEFSTATNTTNVPLVEAPPPAAVGQQPPADPAKPTIYSFVAERDTLAAGESVVLSWDLENAREAYLRYNGREEGVVSPGSKRVSPQEDTLYTLIARNDNGETTAQVTIRVTAPASTSVPVLRDGRVTIVNGQAIDFDRGVIQEDSGPEIDFVWDFRQGGFLRRNGAIGTLVGVSFADLTFDDCATTAYGDPLNNVDISSSVVGCYRTGEDRFGKFAITAWDLRGQLTIDWLTWNN